MTTTQKIEPFKGTCASSFYLEDIELLQFIIAT